MQEPRPDDFIRALGLPFLAHLLRRISDRLVADAGDYEAEIGIRAPPRTASTVLLLRTQGARSVTEIAEQLRQSHPLVITWITQLKRLGFVTRSIDSKDARRTLVALTDTGHAEADRMAAASERIGRAYEMILADADAPIQEALWRIHDHLARGDLAALLRADR